jgi:hypothetical protein
MITDWSHQTEPPVHRSIKFGFLVPWVALILVGTALFWINWFGYQQDLSDYDEYLLERYHGWPMIIAIEKSLRYVESSPEWSRSQPYFRRLSLYENLAFGIILLPSVFFTLNYLRSRWKNRNQFFLSELLILITAAAILCTFFVHYEMKDYWFPRNTTEALYQRLHFLPWFLRLPLWLGVFCTALSIAAAIVHGLRLFIPRRRQTTDP